MEIIATLTSHYHIHNTPLYLPKYKDQATYLCHLSQMISVLAKEKDSAVRLHPVRCIIGINFTLHKNKQVCQPFMKKSSKNDIRIFSNYRYPLGISNYISLLLN